MIDVAFISNATLILISALGVGLALLVYFSGRKEKINRGFTLMVITILSWVVFYHFATLSTYYNFSLILFKLATSSVFLFFIIYYFFIIKWFLEKDSLFTLLGKLILIYGTIFSLLTIFTNYVLVNLVHYGWGVVPIFSSWGWFIFYGYVISLTILINALLVANYFPSPEEKKQKIKYFLIGLFLFAGLNFIFNVVLQVFFNIYKLYQLGNYSVIFLIGFTAYAIVKNQLFNIKVIAAEILTFIIWTAILVQLFTANNINDRILDAGLFLFVVIFGIFLIYSVKKEIEQREQLDRISKYKSELISIVSHQLKNPLAIIKGYASLVGDETIKEPSKIREAYKKIQFAVDKLVNLLNNLLDLGHIEDGKMRYEMENIDLKKLVADAVEDFQFPAGRKNITLTLKTPEQDIFVKCDPYKLSQVFRNLIDNALKYTEAGWVKVVVALAGTEILKRLNSEDGQKTDAANPQEYVLITISDSGKGMNKETIDAKLFKRFSRSTTEKQMMGSGLGLYISKEIIEGHGGKIWAESPGESKGSVFYVALPFVNAKI